MENPERAAVEADVVRAFKGVAPTAAGDHVLLKLEVGESDRVFAIRTQDTVPIAINMLAGAIQAETLVGRSPEAGVMLQGHACEVVLSGDRLLLRIISENNVGFVFDFAGDKAAEVAASLGDLARLMGAAQPAGSAPQ